MNERRPTHPSGATSPSGDDSASSSPSVSDLSITELSRQFDRQSIQSSRQTLRYDAAPFRPYDFHPSQQPNHNPTAFNSSQAVLQRQYLTRRPCNPAHFSKLHTMVEGLLSDEQSRSSCSSSSMSANTTSPLSPLEDTLPPLPSSYQNLSAASSPASFSENEESDSSRGDATRYLHHKFRRDLRHSHSREGVAKQNVVLKSIRFRRSFQKKRALEGKKWRE